ncbi:MAG: pseudouridine-5'-phosphate glycosidase [Deltaproteobacteria bacterium]|nr:MAG: pseudouridine-5'-phosphate glycosidase [Deltaproteobacteria bacterium]
MIAISEEVRRAIEGGTAVALETSVVAQGLPPPHNLDAARRCARAIRDAGAVPAAVAVIGGRIVVGATDAELQRLADPALGAAKAGVRDLAALCAAGRDAGTTVSATCAVAARAGIRVFATGGIGGVHRRGAPTEPLDVSSDLLELSRRQVCVVCAGPKVILDLPATVEALEALGVPVLGFGSSELPAFFTDSSGIRLEHRFDDVASVARALRIHWDELGHGSGVLVCVPPPAPLSRAEVERAISAATGEAARRKLAGKELTPFLLARLAEASGGRTVQSNLELLENNARVAGDVAVALGALR